MDKSSKRAKERYPNLNEDGYEWTSEPDLEYNCLAWAAGKNDVVWQNTIGYYWPATRRTTAGQPWAAKSSVEWASCPCIFLIQEQLPKYKSARARCPCH